MQTDNCQYIFDKKKETNSEKRPANTKPNNKPDCLSILSLFPLTSTNMSLCASIQLKVVLVF